jgi:hypothetical protein
LSLWRSRCVAFLAVSSPGIYGDPTATSMPGRSGRRPGTVRWHGTAWLCRVGWFRRRRRWSEEAVFAVFTPRPAGSLLLEPSHAGPRAHGLANQPYDVCKSPDKQYNKADPEKHDSDPGKGHNQGQIRLHRGTAVGNWAENDLVFVCLKPPQISVRT